MSTSSRLSDICTYEDWPETATETTSRKGNEKTSTPFRKEDETLTAVEELESELEDYSDIISQLKRLKAKQSQRSQEIKGTLKAATSSGSHFKNKKASEWKPERWNPLVPPLKCIGIRFIDPERSLKTDDSPDANDWNNHLRLMLDTIVRLGDQEKPTHLENELIEVMLDERNVWMLDKPNNWNTPAYEKLTFYHVLLALKWLKTAFTMVNAKTREIDEDELRLWWLHNYKNESDPQVHLKHNQSLLKTTELLYQIISCALYLYQPNDVVDREIPGIPDSGDFQGKNVKVLKEKMDSSTQVALPENPFEQFDDDVLEIFETPKNTPRQSEAMSFQTAKSQEFVNADNPKKYQQSVDSHQTTKNDPTNAVTVSLVTDLINAKFDVIRNMIENITSPAAMPVEKSMKKEQENLNQ
ncbi:unnamed protein product [Aphanomyces euteiches]